MKITYYCAMSSDGFIATNDGDVSWLDEMDIDESASNYDEFFASVDGLAMGRSTYDFIFNYGSWPYGDVLTWVFTSKDLKPLEGANLSLVQTVDDFLQQAKAKKMKHIWLVGGGKLASAFLERDILTNLSITEMPIELNAGIPLFSDHKLENIRSKNRESIQKQGCKQIEILLK
jgi:dihydrofolate reductase